MRVLIIKLSSIGDVVHTLPAVRSLRRGFDESGVKVEVDWLVEESASTILKDRADIDNVFVVKNRGWRKDFSGNLRMARMLASRGYDMVLDFQGLLKSGIWVMLSRGKKRIGFSNAREMSHVFLNEKLPPYDSERHAVDRYMDLARHAGGAVLSADEATSPVLDTTGEASRKVASKLKKHGIEDTTPFFVLITQARWPTKLWPPERFAELGRRILEREPGMKVVLIGDPSDHGRLDAIKSRMGSQGKDAVNLAGSTDLRELAALLDMAAFVITVDSGPMHIAAAAGAAVIALFGPTAPWRTGPYGRGHKIIRKDLPCSPCFKKDCDDIRCMEEITVEEVLNALDDFLKDILKDGKGSSRVGRRGRGGWVPAGFFK